VRDRNAGMTLIEIIIVVAVVGIMVLVATFGFSGWQDDQRLKSAARSVADAFLLARGEAIRTGNVHFVVFDDLGATAPIEIVNDGTVATANCKIDAGETVHQVAAVQGVVWGTTATLANGTPAPGDPGLAVGNIAAGSSSTDASLTPANDARWVRFEPDGLPRLFTPNAGACGAVGFAGQGGGAIYVTNTERDYAVVLTQLGTARVHRWNPDAGAWSQ